MLLPSPLLLWSCCCGGGFFSSPTHFFFAVVVVVAVVSSAAVLLLLFFFLLFLSVFLVGVRRGPVVVEEVGVERQMEHEIEGAGPARRREETRRRERGSLLFPALPQRRERQVPRRPWPGAQPGVDDQLREDRGRPRRRGSSVGVFVFTASVIVVLVVAIAAAFFLCSSLCLLRRRRRELLPRRGLEHGDDLVLLQGQRGLLGVSAAERRRDEGGGR